MSRKIAGIAPAGTTEAAAGLLPAAGLAACGSGSGSTGSPGTTFTYWTSQWQPAEIAAVDKAFARAHPGMHAQGQYIASSDEYLPEIAQSGDLIPLDGKLTAQTSALYPGIRQALFYRGAPARHGHRERGRPGAVLEQKEFAAAGITSPPATWAQLTADAKKLTRPGGKQYGIYIPAGDAAGAADRADVRRLAVLRPERHPLPGRAETLPPDVMDGASVDGAGPWR